VLSALLDGKTGQLARLLANGLTTPNTAEVARCASLCSRT
jgi:hypothetical protein